MNRRDFIKIGGVAAVPALGPRLVFGGNDVGLSQQILVCVFQRGAADGLNLVVPYTESNYYAQRPTIAIAAPGRSGAAIDLDGTFGLHPELATLAPLYGAGRLAIVHAVGSPHDSRSHFDAQDFMEFGSVETGRVDDGWLNRHLRAHSNGVDSPFRGLSLGQSLPLSLRGELSATSLDSFDRYDLQVPADHYDAIRHMIDGLFDQAAPLDATANSALASIDLLKRIAPQTIPVDHGAAYPQTNFGQDLAGLAQLIKADVGIQVACVDIGGWDHHDKEGDVLGELCRDFAESLSAFDTDLGNIMERVTVVTMTEFGRRLAENASLGTDHGHGSVMFVMGAGVYGGQVYADWPGLRDADLYRGDLDVSIDFRTVLSELLLTRQGATDLDFIFPGFSGATSLGLFAQADS